MKIMTPAKFFVVFLMSGIVSSAWGKEKDFADKEILCLAQNIYFEARGEPLTGQFAVAAVTMNRVASNKYPKTICKVVWQPFQFSWTHDGKSDRPQEQKAWQQAHSLAKLVYAKYFEFQKNTNGAWDLTKGALHYYAPSLVSPYWAKSADPTATIGKHVFVAYKY